AEIHAADAPFAVVLDQADGKAARFGRRFGGGGLGSGLRGGLTGRSLEADDHLSGGQLNALAGGLEFVNIVAAHAFDFAQVLLGRLEIDAEGIELPGILKTGGEKPEGFVVTIAGQVLAELLKEGADLPLIVALMHP